MIVAALNEIKRQKMTQKQRYNTANLTSVKVQEFPDFFCSSLETRGFFAVDKNLSFKRQQTRFQYSSKQTALTPTVS